MIAIWDTNRHDVQNSQQDTYLLGQSSTQDFIQHTTFFGICPFNHLCLASVSFHPHSPDTTTRWTVELDFGQASDFHVNYDPNTTDPAPITLRSSRMRRWRGVISNTVVELTVTSYDDDSHIDRLLTTITDDQMESLSAALYNDTLIYNSSYVSISNDVDIRGLNDRLLLIDTTGPFFLRTHNLQLISVFTFTTNGPVGFNVNPSR